MATPVSGGPGPNFHEVHKHTSQVAPSKIQAQPKIGISHLRDHHNIDLGEDPQTEAAALRVFSRPV